MKRIDWIIVVVAIVIAGYFFNSYLEKNARRKAERAEEDRIEQVTKTAVSQMVLSTNAVGDWEANLSKGEKFRFAPILTVELERLWLQQRPILFIGTIKDITTHDQSQYMVLVERDLFGSLGYMFETKLQLSLLSDRDKVDSLLKEHSDLFKGYGYNSVAIVARINSVSIGYADGWEGELVDVKIGDGELLDILYTGDITF